MEENWRPAERVQKNDAGEFRALIDGQWIPAQKAQKNGSGEYRVIVNNVDRIPNNKLAAVYEPEKSPDYGAFAGPLETGLSAVTGAVGGLVGNIAGAGRRIATGMLEGISPKQAMLEGADTAAAVQRAFTYEPKSVEGKKWAETLGNVVSESKIAGLGPSEAILAAETAPLARAGAGNLARTVEKEGRATIADLRQPKAITGMGSAMTDADRIRMERAQSLPIPIDLTKGQATRTFEQQQFERETAKNPTIGDPLRQRYADQNEKILSNFDAFVDSTGAESPSLRSTGIIVNDAIAQKAKAAKGAINFAYDKAREAGEMSAPIEVSPLKKYLESHQPEAINAPVIASVDAKLKMIEKNGAATINDLEELRKMAGRLGQKDPTNAHYSKEINALVDQMTEGAGGDLYKRARALRYRYAKEFEDVGVIDKMMRTKPGTSDRAVAYEDIFNHSILSGSLDDVKAVRKTLKTAGPQGEQAWRELQGETIKHLKNEITKNVSTDIRGNRIVSAHKLDTLVTELDRDGKLDFIFGKKGAQQIRDVNDIAKDVYTAPPGSVNSSNTASILIGLLDTALSGSIGVPAPVGTALHQGVKALKNRALKAKVQEALSP